MEYRVLVSHPSRSTELFKIGATNPYEAIEKSRETTCEICKDRFGDTLIDSIRPIHNLSGLRDIAQLDSLKTVIKNGHILKDELPNIRLAVAPDSSLLLFDGHHSLLAYLHDGKRLLKEVPYLVISLADYQPLSSRDVAPFFPEFSQIQVADDWQKFVVNWQANGKDQIEQRKFQTFGELASALGQRNESSRQQYSPAVAA